MKLVLSAFLVSFFISHSVYSSDTMKENYNEAKEEMSEIVTKVKSEFNSLSLEFKDQKEEFSEDTQKAYSELKELKNEIVEASKEKKEDLSERIAELSKEFQELRRQIKKDLFSKES